MNEPFDAELGRAVKESAAKSLEGWEFTPAMQSSVLERIRAGAAGAAPPSRPSPRIHPGSLVRPLTWTAVAAAALLVVVNTDLLRIGGSARKGAPTQEMAQSTPAGSAAQEAAPNSEPPTTGAGTAPQVASAPGSESGSKAQADIRGADSQGGQTAQPGDLNRSAEPAQPAPVPTVGASTATQPGASEQKPSGSTSNRPAITGQPGGADNRGVASIRPQPYAGGTVALQVPPPADKSKAPPPMGIMAVTREKLSVQAGGGQVVELSLSGVRSLGTDGAEAWFYPMEGITEESLLAVAGDGSVAVAVAHKVQLLSSDGKLRRTLECTQAVTALAWGPGGRLAIAAGSVVTVVAPGANSTEFRTEAITQPELAFSPDGTLAVAGGGKAGRQVLLYGVGGEVIMRVSQDDPPAQGLAFMPGGLVAGAQAYDRAGRPLWRAPFRPDGLSSLGRSDNLVVWNAGTVTAVRTVDGIPVWQATWGGPGEGLRKVVPSADGRFLAVLGSTEEGWVLWILDQSGKVLHVERLPDQPSGMAFVGERLLLLMPQSAEFREFPH